jgi:hypothetical protein
MLWVVFATFLLHRELPDMILGDKPLLSQWRLCHSWLSEQDWDQTHTKASKNHNNIVSEEWLAHIRTIVVSLGGKLTYLFICLYGIASPKVRCDFWSVDLILLLMTILCCLWSCTTIRAYGCLFCCLWNFWLFVITVRTLSGYENTNGPWR